MATNILHIASTPEQTAARFAEFLSELPDNGSMEYGVALSGGSTPNLLFKHLTANYSDKMPWNRLHLFWGDERCVPHDHEESNYGMARQLLLDHVSIPADRIHPIHCSDNPEQEAQRYAQLLAEVLEVDEGIPLLHLIILGLGADGHTASIFPNATDLIETEKTVGVATHPVSGQTRLTLTLPVINRADQVTFLATGASKAERVADIILKRPGYKQYPAAMVDPAGGECHWFLDEAAASQLD